MLIAVNLYIFISEKLRTPSVELVLKLWESQREILN